MNNKIETAMKKHQTNIDNQSPKSDSDYPDIVEAQALMDEILDAENRIKKDKGLIAISLLEYLMFLTNNGDMEIVVDALNSPGLDNIVKKAIEWKAEEIGIEERSRINKLKAEHWA